ncbi:MAG: DUF4168 domain-containing protein [Desulfuromonadaceae bacterium]
MHTKSIALTLTLIFALLSGFAGTGFAQPDYAQNQGQSQAQSQAQGQAAMQGAEEMEIDDSTIDQFVGVAQDLGEIRDEYVKKFEGIEDQQKAQSLQAEMNDNMIDVVHSSQIDAETYNYLANQLNVDEELRNKVQSKL